MPFNAVLRFPLYSMQFRRLSLDFTHVPVVYAGYLPIVPGDCDRIPTRLSDNAAISGIASPINAGALLEIFLDSLTVIVSPPFPAVLRILQEAASRVFLIFLRKWGCLARRAHGAENSPAKFEAASECNGGRGGAGRCDDEAIQ